MGELEEQSKWIKLAFFFTVIGFLLLLSTNFIYAGVGGQVTAVLGSLFYTAAIILITTYIFVNEAQQPPVLITFIVLSICAGILVMIQIFSARMLYNSTKGFLSGISAIAAGVMAILTMVLG